MYNHCYTGPMTTPQDPHLQELLDDAKRLLDREKAGVVHHAGTPASTTRKITVDRVATIIAKTVRDRFRGIGSFGMYADQISRQHDPRTRSTRFSGRIALEIPFSINVTDEALADADIDYRIAVQAKAVSDAVIAKLLDQLGAPAPRDHTLTPDELKRLFTAPVSPTVPTPAEDPIPAMPFDKE
jgi:hypothetical protein